MFGMMQHARLLLICELLGRVFTSCQAAHRFCMHVSEKGLCCDGLSFSISFKPSLHGIKDGCRPALSHFQSQNQECMGQHVGYVRVVELGSDCCQIPSMLLPQSRRQHTDGLRQLGEGPGNHCVSASKEPSWVS